MVKKLPEQLDGLQAGPFECEIDGHGYQKKKKKLRTRSCKSDCDFSIYFFFT